MFDFFRNYSQYKQIELDNISNHTEKKLTLKEKMVYFVMIVFCLTGFFLNPIEDDFLLKHTDLIVILIMSIIYIALKIKKRK